jgi:hypothetical protein
MFDCELALLIGRGSADPPEATLRQVWEQRGAQLMADHAQPGWRPWGFWHFEVGEERPTDRAAETVRLAELGELTADEVAAVAEKATEARLRIGTPAERLSNGDSVDRPAVELYEAVLAAQRAA